MDGGLPSALFSRDAGLDPQAQRAAMFLGLQINYLLWGIQIVQSYYYYKSFRTTDHAWMKAAVGILLTLDAVQSIFTSVFCWRITVQGLVVLTEKSDSRWTGDAIPFLDALTASVVHIVYAQKIWTLLRIPYSYVCTAIVLTLSGLQLSAGFGTFLVMTSIDMSFSKLQRIKEWASIWLFTAVVTDIFITIIMTWWLSRSRTGVKRTDDLVSKLIRLIVETGLAAAIVQTVEAVLYLTWPLKPYHLVLVFLVPKVYSNSMLVLLNSRKSRIETCSACDSMTTGMQITTVVINTSRTVDITDDFECSERRAVDSAESVTPKTTVVGT